MIHSAMANKKKYRKQKMTNDSSFLNYHFIQNQKNTSPHHPVIKICNVRSDLGTKKTNHPH